MPTSGPVYQPTTVSYEQQGEWTSGRGFLAQTVGTSSGLRCVQYLSLILGLIGIAAGLVLLIDGSVDYSDTTAHEIELGTTEATEVAMKNHDVVIIVIGVLLLIVGLAFLAMYIRLATRRKGCPCLMTKEQRIARQLRDSQHVNGQVMNPSTDLLVTAQYAPVSEISYQPPGVSEEEETRKLMGSDNKDCILKESDSVISLNEKRFEPDDSPEPRRLTNYPKDVELLGQMLLQEEKKRSEAAGAAKKGKNSGWKNSILRKASVRSKKAPLAGGEEITPSLRSSWASVYMNDTPTPSDSDIGDDLNDARSFSSDSV